MHGGREGEEVGVEMEVEVEKEVGVEVEKMEPGRIYRWEEFCMQSASFLPDDQS
jgi:hypothetical protein